VAGQKRVAEISWIYIGDKTEKDTEIVMKLRNTDPTACRNSHEETGNFRSSVPLVNKFSFLLRTTPRPYREHLLVSSVRRRLPGEERSCESGHLWEGTCSSCLTCVKAYGVLLRVHSRQQCSVARFILVDWTISLHRITGF
jgi:hypothetical protein